MGCAGRATPLAMSTAPLAAAMARLCDAATLARLATAARARSGGYGVDAMVDQTLDVYRQTLAGRHGGRD